MLDTISRFCYVQAPPINDFETKVTVLEFCHIQTKLNFYVKGFAAVCLLNICFLNTNKNIHLRDFFPFGKGCNLEGKKKLLYRSKFFPFRVDFFSEGALCARKQTGSHENCLPCCKNGKKSAKYQVPLNFEILKF